MRKLLFSMLTAALCVSVNFGSAFAADSSAKEELDDHAREVNHSAKKEGMDLALRRISTETGVPVERVQAMHKKYSDSGPAGLMIACVLANETKKEPEEFLKRRSSGKSWTSIAKENNVSLEKLSSRLNRLDNAIGESDQHEKKQKDKK